MHSLFAAAARAAGRRRRTERLRAPGDPDRARAWPATPRCCARRSSCRDATRRKRSENSGFFLFPDDQRAGVTYDGRPREAARPDDARRRHANREVLRRSGLHHPSRRITTGSTSRRLPVKTKLPDAASQPWPMGDEPSAKPAAGHRSIARISTRRSTSPSPIPNALTAAFIVVYKGRDRRRTVHAGNHEGHAARKLVDGQEPDGDAVRAAGEGRRLQDRRAGARFPSGRSRAIRARRSGSRIFST